LRSLLSLDRGNHLVCSVERLIREALALCGPELDQVNAKVRVATASRLPAVLVDSLQIEQTLLNLIRNSIDAFKAASISGGKILIEAAAAGEGSLKSASPTMARAFRPTYRKINSFHSRPPKPKASASV
jgi:C4-dicarboxylate-specific signal transduction histidine kinase